jgi:outer membrane lipoprotein-sorting protein
MKDKRLPLPRGQGRGGGRPSPQCERKKESSSFLKKRSKRLLFFRRSHDWRHGRDLSAGARIKVFLLLFLQKKKAFLFLVLFEEKKQKTFIFPAVLVLLLSGCVAPRVVRLTAQDADDVRRVQDYLNRTERFEAHFVQSGAYGPGAGLVWLDRPGNLRIDYEGPGSRLMVISGGRVRVLDRRTGALTTMSLSRTPLGILLAPTIDLSGPVTVTSVQHVAGELGVTLERTGQAGQGSLTLFLAEMPLRLQAVTVTDAYQRSSTLSLSDIDTAPALTPDLFAAPVGPGAG